MRWPDQDTAAMARRDTYRQGAAVCRRGHVETHYLQPGETYRRAIAENCPTCGARVLTACPHCDLRIRGNLHVPNAFGFAPDPRPSFCDGCGSAFPWATREERIHELENLLDEENIDEADRVVVQDQLTRLRDTGLSERDEKQAWETIKRRTGRILTGGAAGRVVEGLVSAALRQQLGL